ncbi:MAG: hypothetical protein GY906_28440 [bacterium]|nr:hypothetical protein [bacterium]
MIYLLGDAVEAAVLATEAGLAPHEWERLFWREQLAGLYRPDVVFLDSAPTVEGYNDIIDMIWDREGTIWSEVALMQGKVPREQA